MINVSRLIKEITVAARETGGDPDGNPRLRTAVATAKAANMPADNIKRAILKGTGQLPGVIFESLTYEGYGPGGVALYLEVLTDNKNRTVADIRHILSKYGGNLGANGCVAWMFDRILVRSMLAIVFLSLREPPRTHAWPPAAGSCLVAILLLARPACVSHHTPEPPHLNFTSPWAP